MGLFSVLTVLVQTLACVKGLVDISRTGQVADWTTCGCHRRLCVLSFRSFGGICETATCPVRELTSA